MRYGAKIDANKPEIVKALRKVGSTVNTFTRSARDVLTCFAQFRRNCSRGR